MEINGRVKYSFKSILVKMEEEGLVDMDSPTDQFCVSWFTLRVANADAAQAVQAWNEHPIPGMFLTLAIEHQCIYILYIVASMHAFCCIMYH